jgi:hypothetical protein
MLLAESGPSSQYDPDDPAGCFGRKQTFKDSQFGAADKYNFE